MANIVIDHTTSDGFIFHIDGLTPNQTGNGGGTATWEIWIYGDASNIVWSHTETLAHNVTTGQQQSVSGLLADTGYVISCTIVNTNTGQTTGPIQTTASTSSAFPAPSISLSATKNTVTVDIATYSAVTLHSSYPFWVGLYDAAGFESAQPLASSLVSTNPASYTFSGLDPGTVYVVVVYAINPSDQQSERAWNAIRTLGGNRINIYVGNGVWKTATPYIYDNHAWHRATPHIYNGGWN